MMNIARVVLIKKRNVSDDNRTFKSGEAANL